MNDYKILALDETGKASFNYKSKNFILSGLIFSESFRDELDAQIRDLKRAYLDNEKLVFHCRDIIREKGKFAFLRNNPEKEKSFWSEFISILESQYLSLAFVVTNKEKAKKLGWNDIAILKHAYRKMLEEFAAKYLINHNGKIIVESEPYQDKYLIGSHNRLQSIGVPSEGITAAQYRSQLTCLSLVNKLNLDNEVQIADSLAIMANIFYKFKLGKAEKITNIECKMKKFIDKKILDTDNPSILEILV